MFKCQFSNQQSRVGEKPVRVVTKTRPKVYTRLDRNGLEVVIGKGWEIVEEKLVKAEFAKEVKNV